MFNRIVYNYKRAVKNTLKWFKRLFRIDTRVLLSNKYYRRYYIDVDDISSADVKGKSLIIIFPSGKRIVEVYDTRKEAVAVYNKIAYVKWGIK